MSARLEEKKSKAKKKTTRRKKDASTSENASSKLDELANELEMALSQNADQPISSLSDDEDANPKTSKSDNSQPLQTNSTITISKSVNFFSDYQSQKKLPSITRKEKPINKQTRDPLQVDSITPMEVEMSNKRTHYMSFLSEDDDENNKSISSMSTQEYISPLDFTESTPNQDAHLPVLSYQPSSNQQMEIISDQIPELAAKTNDRTTISSSISSNTLSPKHRDIVLRLLNVLTQLPVPSEHLRLVRRRTPKKIIPEESVATPVETKIVDEMNDPVVNETTPAKNPVSKSIDKPTASIDDTSADRMSSFIESLLELKEQIPDHGEHEDRQTNAEEMDPSEITGVIVSEAQREIDVEDSGHMKKMETIVSAAQLQTQVEENPPTEVIDATIDKVPAQPQVQVEEKNPTVSEKHEELPMPMEEDHCVEENNTKIIETPQQHSMIDHESQSILESISTISEIREEPRTSIETTPRLDRSQFNRNVKKLPLLHPLGKSTIANEASSVISIHQEPTVRLISTNSSLFISIFLLAYCPNSITGTSSTSSSLR